MTLEETILERHQIANMTTALVAAQLGRMSIALEDLTPGHKAAIVAHSTQLAFAIAKAVTMEDIRRHGNRIDES